MSSDRTTVGIRWADWRTSGEITATSFDITIATYDLLDRLPTPIRHAFLDGVNRWHRHQDDDYSTDEEAD